MAQLLLLTVRTSEELNGPQEAGGSASDEALCPLNAVRKQFGLDGLELKETTGGEFRVE